ncbi:hypothetical protein [Enterobacter sp. BIDMC 26]|uniref:hypothetical protein n=1 Tax=Enterobacter sp. BIDMC 26 TaxID=1329838 RepID=UPI0012DF132D|nr:hypothetical protein [Enterobacter sp. BIDMC 26]
MDSIRARCVCLSYCTITWVPGGTQGPFQRAKWTGSGLKSTIPLRGVRSHRRHVRHCRFILRGQMGGLRRRRQFAAGFPHEQTIAAARYGDKGDVFLQIQLGERATQLGDHHPDAVVGHFHSCTAPADLHQLFLGQHLALRLGQCGETQARALGEGNGLLLIRPGKFSGLLIQR